MQAMEALKGSEFFKQALGADFVAWLLGMKQSEVNRFLAAEPDWEKDPDKVTTWEHREYFTRY